MKLKNRNTFFAIFLVSAMIFSSALATVSVAKSENANDNSNGQKPSASPSPSVSASPSADPSITPSPSPKNKGQMNAEEHRSAVADFVQALVSVADREGGIGEQVRVIAQEQNQSEETTTMAIEQVEKRSKIKTFLFGSDYKNLGALRSEMVQTRNRINQLTRITERTQNAASTIDAADTIEIQNQIQVLEEEQTKIENFVKAQAGKFSLFGWLVKLFSK